MAQEPTDENDLARGLKDFPNFLDLNCPTLTPNRLRAKLHSLEQEDEDGDICEEESVFKLNFKSWVYLKLGFLDKAMLVNDEVIKKTKWGNMMAIGNRVYLSLRVGKEKQAWQCKERLDMMKTNDREFAIHVATAKAELAYSYSGIGGPSNLSKSLEIFEEALQTCPHNYHWKLRLGLVYRRSTHPNILSGMRKDITMDQCTRKALEYLTDVTKNCKDNRLRGPAFSELAVLCHARSWNLKGDAFSRIFGKVKPEEHCMQLCSKALACDGISAWILTNCGKVLRYLDPGKAIKYLEEALRVRENTSVYHFLGICYQALAKKARQRDNLYEKAMGAYENAIKVSHGDNIPAVYSLGLLLNLAGQSERALERFNQITNSPVVQDGNLLTLIQSYEQAGLCYMKIRGSEARAEEKFTKAISLAARVVSDLPELTSCAKTMWESFTILERSGRSEPRRDERLIRLLNLVRDYSKVVEVLQNMLARDDGQLDNVEVIKSGLRSYLELRQYEKALAFLNMANTRPKLITSEGWNRQDMVDIRSKILLSVCAERLQRKAYDVRLVFRDLFKLCYGRCVGSEGEDMTDTSVISDVIVVYNDSQDSEEGLSSISKSVVRLQQALSHLFGLDNSQNLQGSVECGPKLTRQLEEMKRYQVVILMLGDEEGEEFNGLLEMVPALRTATPKPTILVVDTRSGDTEVPLHIRHCRSFKLRDIGGFTSLLEGARALRDQGPEHDILQEVFDGDVDAVMKLFCFIVDKQWPCP